MEAGQYIEDNLFLLKLRATDRTNVAITNPKLCKKKSFFFSIKNIEESIKVEKKQEEGRN